ncbi:deoxyribonuclease IV [Halanaerobium salsuginis]|uniref:Probable endonuclease 4 n=1 Tax=Halanaerobium salsuginis TaxID=29563 RepID=A0A1I4F9T6_9FIRM|nr:deoxyribonuclease IV [Halanaerobium salsuginis]SFL14050.1 Endonuclease IV [Halanaerobium salsuginis]
MILGKHVSIAGGIAESPARAAAIDCNTMQIFVGNPRGWKNKDLPAAEIKEFKQKRNKYNINPVVVHAAYLINLASPKQELWEKSISALKSEYKRCDRLGAEYLVFHPGSHTGSGFKAGINRISQALNDILAEVESDTMILLENTAGAGTTIGAKFSQLGQIIDKLDQPEKIGVCLDSCHAFAAEYNLTKKSEFEHLLDDFKTEIGLDKLKVIHLNDSKHDSGSKKDEHAHPGQGKLGKKAIARIINNPQLQDKVFILETPSFDDCNKDDDIILLHKLRD